MKLTELVKMFREARKKATQGNAEVFRMDGDCGYFNFMLEIPGAEDHIVAHFSESDNPKSKQNAEFNMACLNHILELTEKAEKMQKALEFYADTNGQWGPGLVELDIKNNYQPLGNKARQVLAEVEG